MKRRLDKDVVISKELGDRFHELMLRFNKQQVFPPSSGRGYMLFGNPQHLCGALVPNVIVVKGRVGARLPIFPQLSLFKKRRSYLRCISGILKISRSHSQNALAVGNNEKIHDTECNLKWIFLQQRNICCTDFFFHSKY